MADAVLPGEVVLIPERPEKTQHHSGTGKQVAETAPEQLAGIGKAAVEANDGDTAKLHAGSGASERGEQKEILRVEKVERGEIDDGVHFGEDDFATERAEQAEEGAVGEREEKRVEGAGAAAFGEIGDWDDRILRMCTIVGGAGEIEFGLNIDFDALVQ